MKRLLISGFVAVALLAATTILRSHSPSDDRLAAMTTGMASAKKSPAVAAVTRLPVEEFEDMSLVFSAPTRTRSASRPRIGRLSLCRALQKLHQRGAVLLRADALLGHLGAGRIGLRPDLEQL